jgi:hypothetical protein
MAHTSMNASCSIYKRLVFEWLTEVPDFFQNKSRCIPACGDITVLKLPALIIDY